jgi:voltage-gated potassium channel
MKSNDLSEVPDNFREIVQFYLIDYQTPLGKLIDIVIIFMNLLVCAIFVADTYSPSESTSALLWDIEVGAVIFFIVEYIARMYGAPSRLENLFNIYSIIDLVAIIPTLLQLVLPLFGLSVNIAFLKTLRAIKVLRIFRFLRFFTDPHFFFGSVTMEMLRVARLVMTILIIFFISSGVFYYVESPVNDQVRNFGDAFYFTVVALTTVGFGDITPVSDAGRWVTVLTIISGIILIPWQASQIVKEWLVLSRKTRVICPRCGLSEHDIDASFCKHCGNVLYHDYFSKEISKEIQGEKK